MSSVQPWHQHSHHLEAGQRLYVTVPSCRRSRWCLCSTQCACLIQVDVLKARLKDPRVDERHTKEVLVRLIYVEMLGHEASWGHVTALRACSSKLLITKKAPPLLPSPL